jgi:lipopolysaccharide transport system permease protein
VSQTDSPSAPPSALPSVTYTRASPLAHPGRLFGEMWRDLAASRELAWRLFVRDISALYRQSILGYLWAFLPPIVTAVSFTFLNAQGIIRVGPTSIPYPAFVMIGTLFWQTFVDALNSPLKSVNSARSMLAKINFPREALILSGIADVLFNFAVRAVLLVPVFWHYHLPVGSALLLVPIGVLGLITLGLAIGLLIVPAGFLYNDVGRGLGLITGFWMLLTPVVYPPPSTGLGAWLAAWNPVSPILSFCRDALVADPLVHATSFATLFAASLVVAVAGWVLYRLSMPILIERIGG